MWPDNETERDFLNFSGVADTIAEVIIQAKGRPVSIGVSGSWGVGKSSLIKLTRCSLKSREETNKPKFLFVEFNAWLYQGYDDARAALMEVIAEVLKAEAENQKTNIEKVQELFKRIDWLRAAKLTAGTAVALAYGLGPIGVLGNILELGRKAIAGEVEKETIAEMEKTATEVGAATTSLLKEKTSSSPPKEIHAIRDCFEEILDTLGVTLVVLIDDLDRCLPPVTISTLEAIRLFLFLRNTAFVIAADNEMIKHAVKQHFEGVDDELIVTNYFDKLIQVPIRVPPLGTQEVRAYMMLLFIENSDLNEQTKEHIRSQVCERLKQSWQGKRVDRAFVASLHNEFPNEIVAKLDTADRLAPLMTTASQIAGNPRLIKRFLNALSIRMTISNAHGVGVDEAVLAKMLLFERCGASKAYAALIKEVNENETGKPRFLADWEEKANAGEELKLDDQWENEFFREWLTVPPRLADQDLRGVLYVSREHAPLITPEDRLSSEAAELLVGLLEQPDMADALCDRLIAIPRSELSIIMGRVLDRARQEQEWGTPAILNACLAITRTDPSQGSRLAGFLTQLPLRQIQASIVPKIGGETWANDVFAKWEQASAVTAPVKKAIQTYRNLK